MLSAEIIAVGSELLTPNRSDTNGLWLTEQLNNIGVEVKLKTIVGDDPERMEEVIRDAIKRSKIVITTGGLGPTEDDITRRVAATAVGRGLQYREDLEEELRERFRRWGREMPEINKRQAYVIEGSDVLPNPNGSAVGLYLEISGRNIAILPGPAREMQPMFEDYVLPRLLEVAGNAVIVRRVIKISGMGESAVDEAIAPIYVTYSDVQTSILINKSEVEVHLAARTSDPENAESTINEIAEKIVAKLGLAVFSSTGESMEAVIGRLLSERGKTLSVAESCTGGLIGSRLTEIPGASNYFVEAAVTYSNSAKVRTLGVLEKTLKDHGAVSAETATEMAVGMRLRSGSDYAISVTGIAGPDGGTDNKPVGTVFIGFADNMKSRSMKLALPGDRFLIRWRSSQAALDYLRRQLIRSDGHLP